MKQVYIANVPFESEVDGVKVEFPADTKLEIDSETSIVNINWKPTTMSSDFIKNNPDIFVYRGVL